jgi:hypothetical protein
VERSVAPDLAVSCPLPSLSQYVALLPISLSSCFQGARLLAAGKVEWAVLCEVAHNLGCTEQPYATHHS